MALRSVVSLACLTIGYQAFLLVHPPIRIRYRPLRWERGCSLYSISLKTPIRPKRATGIIPWPPYGAVYTINYPQVLQWFTGNIGFHHIHHLSPRIPNYLLQKCPPENPQFQQVVVLTLWTSLQSIFLSLWDEEQKKLVGFSHLRSIAPPSS